MAEIKDVYIVAATRTAIGDFGGTLKDVPAAELGSTVIAEAIRRSGLTLRSSPGRPRAQQPWCPPSRAGARLPGL